jgi:hypothetical protein
MKKPIISRTGSKIVKMFSKPPQAGAGWTLTLTMLVSTPAWISSVVIESSA